MNGPEDGVQSRGLSAWELADLLVNALNYMTAQRDRLAATLTELDSRLSWHTTCRTCAHILDSAYEETMRAETAEALAERRRLAWLSARRRAAKESEYAAEALALKDRELSAARALAALDADGA